MSFNTCTIKNIDSQNHIVLGVELAPNEIYTIPDSKRIKASNNDFILDNISLNILQIGNGTNFFETTSEQINYLKGLELKEIDDDGRQIIKYATTYKGWRYLAHVIEVETACITGVYSQDWTGSSRGDYSLNFYDDQDVELATGTQAELDTQCVKTVVTFAPTYDYDIIGGNIHQQASPTEDLRLWVIAGATDLSHLPDTVKEFVGGLNMKFMGADEQITTDGRASARLNVATEGVPVPTNKMQYIFRHTAGFKHKIMIVLEYFRA